MLKEEEVKVDRTSGGKTILKSGQGRTFASSTGQLKTEQGG